MESNISKLISDRHVAVYSYYREGFDVYPLWRDLHTEETCIFRYNKQLPVCPTDMKYNEYTVYHIDVAGE